MATKKPTKVKVGEAGPFIQHPANLIGFDRKGRPVYDGSKKTTQLEIRGGGDVVLISDQPRLYVTCSLRKHIERPVPKPKITIVDRAGAVGLTNWDGRDPYQFVIPMKFEAPGGTVEPLVDRLNAFALRHKGMDEPPQVRVVGPVEQPQRGMRWWVYSIDPLDDDERNIYDPTGRGTTYAADVTLIEYVKDSLLLESVEASRTKGLGISNETTTVKPGETDLYDVSRRVFRGDPSFAAAIARANNIPLGNKLKPDRRLRLP